MQGPYLWKLLTEYSIVHAALLIAGYSPDEADQHQEYDLGRHCKGYTPAKTALWNAVSSGTLKAARMAYDEDDGSEYIDARKTLIAVADLDAFTKARGLVCEFFDREEHSGAGGAGRGSQFFSKKLDAANKAWTAVTSDPTRLRGKSPKQALQSWLVEHAEELGLLNKDGQPNQTGIEEICKVANWKPEGGATPTQSADPPSAPTPLVRLPFGAQNTPRVSFAADLDDEIPF
jgi:hypothetical protein